MRPLAALALLSMVGLLGCACGPTPTQVIVIFDADLGVREDGERLRIDLVPTAGERRTWDLPLVAGETGATSFPVRLPLIPRGGDPSRTYLIVADVLDGDGAVIARQRVSSGYVRDELRYIRVHFSDVCGDELCAVGTTCIDGDCVDDCALPASSPEAERMACETADAGTADAAVDVGPDAGLPSSCDGDAGYIFCSGFEAESEWLDLTTEGGDSTLGPFLDPPRGRWALEALVTDTGVAQLGVATYAQIDTTATELYARFYVKVPSSFQPETFIHLLFLGSTDACFPGLLMGLTPEGGASGAPMHLFSQFQTDFRSMGACEASPRAVADAAIPLDEWVCVEGHMTFGPAGRAELWVRDADAVVSDPYDTTVGTHITQLRSGVTLGAPQRMFRVYIDELVIDDSRIGCLPE